jgi:hypothetical protein
MSLLLSSPIISLSPIIDAVYEPVSLLPLPSQILISDRQILYDPFRTFDLFFPTVPAFYVTTPDLNTDLKLQIRMAYEKNAYWFTKVSKQHFNAPSSTTQYLRQIINSGHNGFDPQIENIKTTFNPDQIIRLEDFIQKKSIPEFAESSNEQLNFLNHWHALQSSKSLNLLER